MTTNADLQTKYEQMHAQGQTAWFSDGENERRTILRIGGPWNNKVILEIGCGQGGLCRSIEIEGGVPTGIDYSKVAVQTAKTNFQGIPFYCRDHRAGPGWQYDRIVLQGVLEHFDDPWTELDWIARNLVRDGGDIITSSPCFINPRGIVWMTLATLFDAPMSLTDLHFLHPWEFEQFAKNHEHVKNLTISYTDKSWGCGEEMVSDLRQRLPKVFPEMDGERIARLVDWLEKASHFIYTSTGATAVYRLELK
ncbi:MAG: class I SAM-dependent methyltransferase [Dehalococcoidia bacterium]|jgi:2-polyprenyl-3-methyl-5-hydroxy-6-metoxy-1,4-benzoquinol methylase